MSKISSVTKEFREQIANEFIKCLEENQLDWKKGWNSLKVEPCNAATGAKYKGVNKFKILMLCAMGEVKDPRFATFMQIRDKGWHLKKGAKGMNVEYWIPYNVKEKTYLTWKEYNLLPDADKDKIAIYAKYYNVFNAKDIEGIPPLELPKKNDIHPSEIISKISKNMNIEILNDGGNKAFYRPKEDKVHLPEAGYFKSDYEYNATALHELSHATGAAHRLNRNFLNSFGSPEYAYEELVAEISSVFMSKNLSECVNGFTMDNHKAYIQSWISQIKEKPETLISAIKEANKAADYLEEAIERTPVIENLKSNSEILEVDKDKIVDAPENGVRERARGKEIKKDLVAHDFIPNKKLVKHIMDLDQCTGKNNTLSDISKMHKSRTTLNEQTKSILDQIVKECQMQEMALAQ